MGAALCRPGKEFPVKPSTQPIVLVPGLRNSGPGHWQTWFESLQPRIRRVQQENWEDPRLPEWAGQVCQTLEETGEPAWIVAHSFGCLASVAASRLRPGQIRGALLVAPADPNRFQIPPAALAGALPFPSLVIASSNDPWVSLASARHWADSWHSDFIDVGPLGHINVDSGHGPWPAVLDYFAQLQAQAQPSTPQTARARPSAPLAFSQLQALPG